MRRRSRACGLRVSGPWSCSGTSATASPDEAWPLLDEVVEIPMVGQGASLNVAITGSLVLHRLAGLA